MIAPFRVVLFAMCVAWSETQSNVRVWQDTRTPVDVMVDVINDLGLNLLKIHSINNENNIALSPYGVASILTALLEGVRGRAAIEIQKCAGFPADKDVIRVGMRDIHRLLRSYFIPEEGFLSGLSLSSEKVILRSEYQAVLRFYGFDMTSFNTPIYPDFRTTTPAPNTTTSSTQTTIPSITTETTLTPTDITTVTPTEGTTIPMEATTTSVEETTVPIEETTMPVEGTTMPTEGTTIPAEGTTIPAEGTTMPAEATTLPDEATTTSAEGTPSTAGTTMPAAETTAPAEGTTAPAEGTTASAEETTTSAEVTTSSTEASKTTTEETVSSSVTTIGTTEKIDEPNERTEATTISENEETTLSATTTEKTKEELRSTIYQLTTITDSSSRSTMTEETTSATIDSSSTEEVTSASTGEVTFTSTETGTFTSTEIGTFTSTETGTFRSTEELTTIGSDVETLKNEGEEKFRKRRSVVDYLIARYYDDHNHNVGMQYGPVPPIEHNKLAFLVNGKYHESHVHFMTYDAILPFYYVHNLNALALRFPLDSPKYYLLLVLPVDEEGIEKLLCDIGNFVTLKQIISHMRPTYVRAVIPSFMLRGFVTLTSTLQKIGIRQIFEPRHTDFSAMTDDKDIYVTNIEQAITVLIKNYMNSSTDYKNRNLYQYGPVEFKATHPFLYFVMDSEIDVALVAGKIVNPINSRIQ